MMNVGTKPPVNDGGGLYDNAGLCDTLVNDCNNLVKYVCSGQYIQFCNTVVQMTLKLANLQKGIKADLASKDEIIEELKRMNDALLTEKTGLPGDGGVNDGST